MNTYKEYKRLVSEKVNKFPKFFAFSNEQVVLGTKILGVDKNNITCIGDGGFIKKSDEEEYTKLMKQIKIELLNKINSDDEFVLDMFRYELDNNKYYLSYNDKDICMACGLDVEEVGRDVRLRNLLFEAKKDYLKNVI